MEIYANDIEELPANEQQTIANNGEYITGQHGTVFHFLKNTIDRKKPKL